MNICYVLRDGDNATNDIFHFSIEDSGKLTLFKHALFKLYSVVEVSSYHADFWGWNVEFCYTVSSLT